MGRALAQRTRWGYSAPTKIAPIPAHPHHVCGRQSGRKRPQGAVCGHFAVTDRLSTGVAEGPYGCCILALSAIQPLHLSDWDGGNRIAIHATDDTAGLGHPASHGCAHVDDADGRWLLGHIPDGTPVVIADAPFHPSRGSPA